MFTRWQFWVSLILVVIVILVVLDNIWANQALSSPVTITVKGKYHPSWKDTQVTIYTNGQDREWEKCKRVGQPDCATPVPTSTPVTPTKTPLLATQIAQLEAEARGTATMAAVQAGGTATIGAVNTRAAMIVAGTRTPVIPTATVPKPTATPITPSPTMPPTSTRVPDCTIDYIASDQTTRFTKKLKPGTEIDLGVLTDGTKVKASCSLTGEQKTWEIPKIIQDVGNATANADRAVEAGINIGKVIFWTVMLIIGALALWRFGGEILRFFRWVHDTCPDFIEYPVGGALLLSLLVLGAGEKWYFLFAVIWGIAPIGAVGYLLIDAAHKFGAKKAADIAAEEIEHQLTKTQTQLRRHRGGQGSNQQRPP